MRPSRCTSSCEIFDDSADETRTERFNPERPPSRPAFPREVCRTAEVPALEAILHELERSEGVQDAILVSRNGTYIAGSVPQGVHVETFAAMFAILLGACENATSELKESLDSVVINSPSSKIVILHSGPKALLVFRLPASTDVTRMKPALEKYLARIEESL